MIKRRTGEVIVTNEKQGQLLKKLYGTADGRRLLKFLTLPIVSKAAGDFMNSIFSKPLIRPFIIKNKIDTSQYQMRNFRSYNQFFTRRIKPGKRPIDYAPSHLISPCDSKLSVYEIDEHSIFRIKGSLYRVSDLLRNDFLARRFTGGYCMIFRLEVDDYHRYCYIDNGTKTGNTFIRGELHTVNPIALKRYNIYKRNSREYTVLHTENFGDVVQVEVGAMLVGRIVNHHPAGGEVKRGSEKGFFEYGGSTVIVLIPGSDLSFREEVKAAMAEDREIFVRQGEWVARKNPV